MPNGGVTDVEALEQIVIILINYFSVTIGFAIRYGAFGSVSGHELSHALDSMLIKLRLGWFRQRCDTAA
jgi:hypothetical protein